MKVKLRICLGTFSEVKFRSSIVIRRVKTAGWKWEENKQIRFYKVEANHQEINESIEKEWNVLHPPRN
ncbi:hypothetical protein HID58_013591, partial [Brassica napus]